MAQPLQCELMTLEEIYAVAWDLGGQVAASGFQPDLVVAVARGGFVPARLLCDFLGVMEMTSLQVRHYAAAAQQEQARIRFPVGGEVAGRRVLLVDDVNDTGDTLVIARNHLIKQDVSELRVAVLHEKRGSRCNADFVGSPQQAWRWIIYPWALVEDVGALLRRLRPPPASIEEAVARLAAEYDLRLGSRQLKALTERMPDIAL
jgi:hypoxanthine phosphoribosyltransferase